jgi:hypothetical protein
MTARKTTPHLKRGRPAKPKLPQPPKRNVGRPRVPLRVRPDRYVLAYYEALVKMGVSRRKAAQILLVLYKGPSTVTADDRSLSVTVRLPTGIDLGDFAKECDRLRALVKWRAAKPDDLAWLRSMSEAIRIAFGQWRPGASDIVMRLAASADETAWATEVLLPMLRIEEPTVLE